MKTYKYELYYLDESSFSRPLLSNKLYEVTAYSQSHQLNVRDFLNKKNKLVYHSTTGSVTADIVIKAFDHFMEKRIRISLRIVDLNW